MFAAPASHIKLIGLTIKSSTKYYSNQFIVTVLVLEYNFKKIEDRIMDYMSLRRGSRRSLKPLLSDVYIHCTTTLRSSWLASRLIAAVYDLLEFASCW